MPPWLVLLWLWFLHPKSVSDVPGYSNDSSSLQRRTFSTTFFGQWNVAFPQILGRRHRRHCSIFVRGNRGNGIQLRQRSHVAKFDDLWAFRTFLRSIFSTELTCLASGFSFMLSYLMDKITLATLDSPTVVVNFEPSWNHSLQNFRYLNITLFRCFWSVFLGPADASNNGQPPLNRGNKSWHGALLKSDQANTGALRWRCLLPWIVSAIWLAAPELLAHTIVKKAHRFEGNAEVHTGAIGGIWKLLKAAIIRRLCCEDTLQDCIGVILPSQQQPIEK